MIRMIAIDETELWERKFISRFPEETKMLGIYCYDDSVIVHCCEMTGSRELHFLGTIPTKVPEDDSIRENQLDMISECDNLQEPISYIWAHTIDSNKFVDSECETIEDIEEDYRCNQSAYELKLIQTVEN